MPDGLFLLCWDSLNLFAILFYIVEIGFLLGFGNTFWQSELKYFSSVTVIFCLVFLADIFISPLKAFYHKGLLVTKRSTIINRYMSFGLWIDIVALIGLVIPYVTQ